jgi:hypothetical protein
LENLDVMWHVDVVEDPGTWLDVDLLKGLQRRPGLNRSGPSIVPLLIDHDKVPVAIFKRQKFKVQKTK